MTPQPPLTVTAVRTSHTDRIDYNVFTYGSTDPLTLEMVADRLRQQAGALRPTPLEEFLQEHRLELLVHHGDTPGSCRVSIGNDVSVRNPEDSHRLHSASAQADSLHEAKDTLARKISGRTIVQHPMLPISRAYQVPILHQGDTPAADNPQRTG